MRPNQYQQLPEEIESNSAVNELQQKAIQALSQRNNRLAIDYLERAIKIEPRNALNWHYLAQSYYQLENFDNCLAMLERSMSYGYPSDGFAKAGLELKKKCRAG